MAKVKKMAIGGMPNRVIKTVDNQPQDSMPGLGPKPEIIPTLPNPIKPGGDFMPGLGPKPEIIRPAPFPINPDFGPKPRPGSPKPRPGSPKPRPDFEPVLADDSDMAPQYGGSKYDPVTGFESRDLTQIFKGDPRYGRNTALGKPKSPFGAGVAESKFKKPASSTLSAPRKSMSMGVKNQASFANKGAPKKMASGGTASSRADGIAQRGKTKGRLC